MGKRTKFSKPLPMTQDGKWGAADLKGGGGQAIVMISQTAMDIPKEEVDHYVTEYKEILKQGLEVLRLKLIDMKVSAQARNDVSPDKMMQMCLGAHQMRHALAGHATKTAEIEVNFAVQELGKTQITRENIKAAIADLDAQVRSMQAMEADVVDEEAPKKLTMRKIVPLDSAKRDFLVKDGYIDEFGKWTGKEIHNPKTAPWVQDVLVQLCDGAVVTAKEE